MDTDHIEQLIQIIRQRRSWGQTAEDMKDLNTVWAPELVFLAFQATHLLDDF